MRPIFGHLMQCANRTNDQAQVWAFFPINEMLNIEIDSCLVFTMVFQVYRNEKKKSAFDRYHEIIFVIHIY